MRFHSGEIAVQTRAGVREEAERVCTFISDAVKPAALEFLQVQQMAIAGASLLTLFNCPKCIQTRHLELAIDRVSWAEVQSRTAFAQTDQDWITTADTFFITTAFITTTHAEKGADASHRGSYPFTPG